MDSMQTNNLYPSGEGSGLHQIVSPSAFLKILRDNKEVIKRSKFISPKIGSKHLGKFYVEYNYAPTTPKKSRRTTAE